MDGIASICAIETSNIGAVGAHGDADEPEAVAADDVLRGFVKFFDIVDLAVERALEFMDVRFDEERRCFQRLQQQLLLRIDDDFAVRRFMLDGLRATEVEVAVQSFRQTAGERDEIAFLRDIDDEAEQFFACFR